MTYQLRLYVTGRTPSSIRAIDNLRDICAKELYGDIEVDVIDVLENPALADDERILATPTLIKRLPEPVRRIVGDLSDRERVLIGLDIAGEPLVTLKTQGNSS
ncbi:circadian clock protein KaiB [Mangrovihabitans endophyticus]|uniref:Circadian clock protein KaiB n=1 Tax=Mangrovihabitans endophyticus TaxID=1751298 RepID=A0A8J3C449_9ACTN|nr:circadian clock protein KaiB [Mangrovihabitans endophyticus]GGL06924.1 circadian clock protein KaiB [Mangrovihabitans endophyticus]GGL06955.1 circadian clock protein KaiB [Mangrovihabitans endophyticus]